MNNKDFVEHLKQRLFIEFKKHVNSKIVLQGKERVKTL